MSSKIKDIESEIRDALVMHVEDDQARSAIFNAIVDLRAADAEETVVDLRINCPECGVLHVDEGEFETKPHHTHACQSCGLVWRPSVRFTRGVKFLPGYKN